MNNKLPSEDFYSTNEHNEEIDLGKIFRFLLMQSKLIISIVVIVFIISFAYYNFATKKYLIQSLIQYEAYDQNIFDPSSALQMASSSSSSDISNLTELYESRTNYLRVIKDLKLNMFFKDLDIDESIDIDIVPGKVSHNETYNLKFSFSETEYVLLDENQNEIQTAKYGDQILFDGFKISINSVNLKDYRPIDIIYRKPEDLYNTFKVQMVVDDNASINSFFRSEALITVSYVSSDIEQGKKIINYAINIFLNQRIYDETENQEKP